MTYSIRVAARRTELSSHVIRSWEKRYQAVSPVRTKTNRRLYSDSDVEKLSLLRQVTRAGHSIGTVAALAVEDLRALLKQEWQRPPNTSEPCAAGARPRSNAEFVEESLAAIRNLDGEGLNRVLKRAELELGSSALLTRVLASVIQRVGDLWQEGVIRVAHEHVATAAIRSFMGSLQKPVASPRRLPGLLVATPAGQWHELGAILVAALARDLGWRVAYLGPSLPAEEIAGAAIQGRVRAIALSIVYPKDDPQLPGELARIRQLVPTEVSLLAGGRAAAAYQPALTQVGATVVTHLREMPSVLQGLRRNGGG
jgi:DNA-binding transcriptional MerR regulator/methylmalonyl-CoA mutase cobalamin-binding subunit